MDRRDAAVRQRKVRAVELNHQSARLRDDRVVALRAVNENGRGSERSGRLVIQAAQRGRVVLIERATGVVRIGFRDHVLWIGDDEQAIVSIDFGPPDTGQGNVGRRRANRERLRVRTDAQVRGIGQLHSIEEQVARIVATPRIEDRVGRTEHAQRELIHRHADDVVSDRQRGTIGDSTLHQDVRRDDVQAHLPHGLALIIVFGDQRHRLRTGRCEDVRKLEGAVAVAQGSARNSVTEINQNRDIGGIRRDIAERAGHVHKLSGDDGARQGSDGQCRIRVADSNLERRNADRAQPRVVGDSQSDRVRAVVGVGVNAIERTQSELSRCASDVDRGQTGVRRRSIAPVDHERERGARPEFRIAERADVCQRQDLIFRDRAVANRRDGGRDVVDGDRELSRPES